MTLKELNLHKPNEGVIEELEDLLARAKEGKVQGIAYAVSYGGLDSSCVWHTVTHVASLLGELCILRARLENQVLREYHTDEWVGE